MPRSACDSKRDQWRSGFRGEGARDEDGLAERTAEALQAADQIDGGTDRGEIEPVGRADIAPQHLAEMQRDAEGQGRLALPPARLVEMRHSGPRSGDGAQRGVAGAGGRPPVDRKDRQHPVADEFQHFAAEGVNRASDAVEPGVEGLR